MIFCFSDFLDCSCWWDLLQRLDFSYIRRCTVKNVHMDPENDGFLKGISTESLAMFKLCFHLQTQRKEFPRHMEVVEFATFSLHITYTYIFTVFTISTRSCVYLNIIYIYIYIVLVSLFSHLSQCQSSFLSLLLFSSQHSNLHGAQQGPHLPFCSPGSHINQGFNKVVSQKKNDLYNSYAHLLRARAAIHSPHILTSGGKKHPQIPILQSDQRACS